MDAYFEVRYKRRYMLLMILFALGMIWMGASMFEGEMSEMFLVFAPAIVISSIIERAGTIPALMIGLIVPACLYFLLPDLAGLLGMIAFGLMFLVVFPLIGLAWLFALFDPRPQLLIGQDGIYCRQASEELIPWNDILFTHVWTYEQVFFLKVRILIINLRDFSSYPKPSSMWSPQYLFYSICSLFKNPDDRASIHISGIVLDPPLPLVMNAIERHSRGSPSPTEQGEVH